MESYQRQSALWIALLIFITTPIFLGYLWLTIASGSSGIQGLVPSDFFKVANWRFLWEPIGRRPMIWLVMLNTLIFAIGTAALIVAVCSMAAYALSRLTFKGRGAMLAVVLLLHAFPTVSLLIATFYVLRTLALFNSLLGVICVMSAFMLPFGIWLLKGFFDAMSWEMEMAALIDGASRWKIFRRVALPLVKPGLFALGIFSFLMAWGEFVMPYTFIVSSKTWIFSIYLQSLIGDAENVDIGMLAAVGVFYSLPAIIVFLVGQKYLLTMYFGGTKG